MNDGTRMVVIKSWIAAGRRVADSGHLTMNAASAAGQYLEAAGGDATRARSMLPVRQGMESTYWARVSEILAEVEREDAAARGPRLKTGT